MANIPIVSPSTGISIQTALEDPQQPLEASANDNQLDNNYVDREQDVEPEPQEQEPGKSR